MAKLKRGFIALSLSLLVTSFCCCTSKPKKEADTKTNDYASKIIGKWRYSEVNGGVTCEVTFKENNGLDQYFRDGKGHDKLRPGSWKIKGDTIWVTDQTGPTTLTIETLNDSVLTLQSLDSFPIFFYRIKE